MLAERAEVIVRNSQFCSYPLHLIYLSDHISGSRYVKEALGGQTAIGAHITDVQKIFNDVFNWTDLEEDASVFDRLLNEGDVVAVG